MTIRIPLDAIRLVPEKEAPHLYKALAEQGRKARVSFSHVYFQNPELKDSALKSSLDYVVRIARHEAHEGPILIIGDEMRSMLGIGNPAAPVNEELSSVIWHELKHLKRSEQTLAKIAEHSPFIGVAAAIGALGLFEMYHTKKDRTESEKLPGEPAYSYAEEAKDRNNFEKQLITAAKYLAAGAIGLTAGTFAQKTLRHSLEFRADKFSAEMMGSGKPLARVLDKLHNALIDEAVATEKRLKQAGVAREEIARIHTIVEAQSPTHPTTSDRIGRLGGL
jgi:hypothetical protein